MSKTRAIRFSDKEQRQIEEFLAKNPFFDFSTLARMAILEFVENPKMTLKAVKKSSQAANSGRQNEQSQ